MTMPNIDRVELEGAMRQSLKEHWRMFAIQGVLLAVLGTVALTVPVIASVTVAVFVGWLLFLAGVMRAFSLFGAAHAPGYWSSLLFSVLTAILGLVIALFPLPGAITLAMVLTAYFIVHGISSFALAFAIKSHTGRWVLVLAGGVIDLALAGLVIAGWPGSSVFILGVYVGINLLFTGFALVFAALGARSA
jgi:uncharacterized membrane protein HdeD (DUF308 family)